jgi:isocitrate/isopropylmalate dehydrogenase
MRRKAELDIAVLDGDGIGPEITAATVAALTAAAERSGLHLRLTQCLIGWKAYERHRTTLPDETLTLLRGRAGWILGPTFAGEYPADDPIRGHPSGYLRRSFALFTNVRPIEAWPQLRPLVPDLDITILRENTQGFYPDRNLAWGYGEFKPTDDVALSLRVVTGAACERFARFCFAHAAARGLSRLAVVHKRTALPQTEGVFIAAFEQARQGHPEVALDLVRVDTFSSSLPRDPHRWKLVATSNLFGDILSDQAAGLAGGVGMAPSLNAGADHAMAQAVHGTAPDIAGQGTANPSALMLSAALLLDWFYQRQGNPACREAAAAIRRAVREVIGSGVATSDLGGTASTTAFAEAVVAAIADKS